MDEMSTYSPVNELTLSMKLAVDEMAVDVSAGCLFSYVVNYGQKVLKYLAQKYGREKAKTKLTKCTNVCFHQLRPYYNRYEQPSPKSKYVLQKKPNIVAESISRFFASLF